jgi:hypothetical protein
MRTRKNQKQISASACRVDERESRTRTIQSIGDKVTLMDSVSRTVPRPSVPVTTSPHRRHRVLTAIYIHSLKGELNATVSVVNEKDGVNQLQLPMKKHVL